MWALTAEVVEPAPVFRIVPATPHDVPAILAMIEALADYEELRPLCVATEGDLRAALFGSRPAAEVLVGWEAQTVVAFALFFHNFSTFLGRKGTVSRGFIRTAVVSPPWLRARAAHSPCPDRCGSRVRPLRMGGAGLECAGYRLLSVIGGGVAAGLAHRSPYRSGTGRPRDRRAGGLVRRASVGELDGASKGCRAHPPAVRGNPRQAYAAASPAGEHGKRRSDRMSYVNL